MSATPRELAAAAAADPRSPGTKAEILLAWDVKLGLIKEMLQLLEGVIERLPDDPRQAALLTVHTCLIRLRQIEVQARDRLAAAAPAKREG